jgi:hypothetical protein
MARWVWAVAAGIPVASPTVVNAQAPTTRTIVRAAKLPHRFRLPLIRSIYRQMRRVPALQRLHAIVHGCCTADAALQPIVLGARPVDW